MNALINKKLKINNAEFTVLEVDYPRAVLESVKTKCKMVYMIFGCRQCEPQIQKLIPA